MLGCGRALERTSAPTAGFALDFVGAVTVATGFEDLVLAMRFRLVDEGAHFPGVDEEGLFAAVTEAAFGVGVFCFARGTRGRGESVCCGRAGWGGEIRNVNFECRNKKDAIRCSHFVARHFPVGIHAGQDKGHPGEAQETNFGHTAVVSETKVF